MFCRHFVLLLDKPCKTISFCRRIELQRLRSAPSMHYKALLEFQNVKSLYRVAEDQLYMLYIIVVKQSLLFGNKLLAQRSASYSQKDITSLQDIMHYLHQSSRQQLYRYISSIKQLIPWRKRATSPTAAAIVEGIIFIGVCPRLLQYSIQSNKRLLVFIQKKQTSVY